MQCLPVIVEQGLGLGCMRWEGGLIASVLHAVEPRGATIYSPVGNLGNK
jgi:hypothetical protein